MRQTLVYVLGGLCLAATILVVILIMWQPPRPGTPASFHALSAASGRVVPHSVPMEVRRAAANTCEGFNLELVEAAGIQTRIGNQSEAQRLLGMRQSCSGAPSAVRSAR